MTKDKKFCVFKTWILPFVLTVGPPFMASTAGAASETPIQAEVIRQTSEDVQLLTARYTGLLIGVDNPGPQTGHAKAINFNDCTYTPLQQPPNYRNYDCNLAYEAMKKRIGVPGSNYLIDTLEWLAAPQPAAPQPAAPQGGTCVWVQADSNYQGSYEFEVVIRKGALEAAESLGFFEQKVTTTYGGPTVRDVIPTRVFLLSASANSLLIPEKTVTLSDGTPGLVYRFLMVGPKYGYTGNGSSGVEIKPYIQYEGKGGKVYKNYDSFPSATTSYRVDLNYPLDRSQNILQ